MPPVQQIAADDIPANGGPQQAQRVGVTVGAGGQAAPAQSAEPARTGLSTGTRLAIGAGAAALFGCYKLGCLNRSTPQPGSAAGPGDQFR